MTGPYRKPTMSYFIRTDIEAEIPAAALLALLDDSRDGAEDSGLYATLANRAERRVDAVLACRYAVPFAEGTVPSPVQNAAIVVFCSALYRRRGVKDGEIPFAERERETLGFLREIAAGKADLDLSLGSGKVGCIQGEGDAPEDDLRWAVANQEGL